MIFEFRPYVAKIVQRLLPGRAVWPEVSDRAVDDVSRGLTPDKLDQILQLADSGTPREQAIICRAIEEKNHTVSHALNTRRLALQGCELEVEPGGDSEADMQAAESLKAELQAAGDGDLLGITDAIGYLFDAVLYGYSGVEIVWKPGGGIDGFYAVPPLAVSFIDGFVPKIITNTAPQGVDVPPNKFVFAYFRAGRDACRGGLIRPLAWLHCFGNLNIKFTLQYLERYGMPFLILKVADNEFAGYLRKYQRLVRDFGSSGGAVVTRGTEAELLQAGSGGNDGYLKFIEYIDNAIIKVILGQTASSSAGGGLSKDNAQSAVRQDILEADAAMSANALNLQLVKPWTRFNFGDTAKPPIVKFKTDPPEDEIKKQEALQAGFDAMGAAVRAGVLTPTVELETEVRKRLNLPPINELAIAAWAESKGVRLPITLQRRADQEQTDGLPPTALEQTPVATASKNTADEAAAELINSGVMAAWLGPVASELEALDEVNDDEFGDKLQALAEQPPFGDSGKFENILQSEVYTGFIGEFERKNGEIKHKAE